MEEKNIGGFQDHVILCFNGLKLFIEKTYIMFCYFILWRSHRKMKNFKNMPTKQITFVLWYDLGLHCLKMNQMLSM